jgi:c-di-GMP-binding flagellar brake protein YcgR
MKKSLFLTAMLNVTALAAAADDENVFDTFGKSIDHAMNKYFTAQVIFLLITVTVLLIIAAVFFEVRRSNKIKREMQDLAMTKFDIQAEKLNLRLSSVAILKKIAQKSGLQDPISILKFSHVFESSLEKFYENEKIEFMAIEMLVQISNLRKELGFSPLPKGIALTSTRQFCSGDKCIVRMPDNDPPVPDGVSYVIDSEERHWSATRPDWPPVQAGAWVWMSLTKQGDAEYTFKTQVLEDARGEFVLCHTSKMNRTQQRNWLRIDVDIPVKITLMEEPHAGDTLSGKIIDISGGGLGMTIAAKLQKNSMLLLNFELPGRGKITDLPVKVVRVAGPRDGNLSRFIHSATFDGETDLTREKIIQFVFEKQRENIQIKQSLGS